MSHRSDVNKLLITIGISLLATHCGNKSNFSGDSRKKDPQSAANADDASHGIASLAVKPILTNVPVGTETIYTVTATDASGKELDVSVAAIPKNLTSNISNDQAKHTQKAMEPGPASTEFAYEGLTVTWNYNIDAPSPAPGPAPKADPKPTTLVLKADSTKIYRGQTAHLSVILEGPASRSVCSDSATKVSLDQTDSAQLKIDSSTCELLAEKIGIVTLNANYVFDDKLTLKADPLKIEIVNRNPIITSKPINQYDIDSNAPYQYQVLASDPDNDKISYEIALGPSFVKIDKSTGKVSIEVGGAQKGKHSIVLKVKDELGGETSQEFVLNIESAANLNVCTNGNISDLGSQDLSLPKEGEWSKYHSEAPPIDPLPNDIRESQPIALDMSLVTGNVLPVKSFDLDDVAMIVKPEVQLRDIYFYNTETKAREFTIPDDALMIYNANNAAYAYGRIDSKVTTIYKFSDRPDVSIPGGTSQTLGDVYGLGAPLIGHNAISISKLDTFGYIKNGVLKFKIVHIIHGTGFVTMKFGIDSCSAKP